MQHDLKTWPAPFEAVWDGRKTFEIRRTDREFSVGDLVVLAEFEPCMSCLARGTRWDTAKCDVVPCTLCGGEKGKYLGRTIHGKITYLIPPRLYGLGAEHCVFSFEILAKNPAPLHPIEGLT